MTAITLKLMKKKNSVFGCMSKAALVKAKNTAMNVNRLRINTPIWPLPKKWNSSPMFTINGYYGFLINVTNCFSGSEKGIARKSTDVLRTELFAVNYTLNSLDDAQGYVKSRILKLNENSYISEEQRNMLPYKPPLELAGITAAKVDKASLISIDTVKYTVPEELAKQTVIVKKYHDEIRVFFDNPEICRHRRR